MDDIHNCRLRNLEKRYYRNLDKVNNKRKNMQQNKKIAIDNIIELFNNQ